jgi:methyl-accepting chemotaxis protein
MSLPNSPTQKPANPSQPGQDSLPPPSNFEEKKVTALIPRLATSSAALSPAASQIASAETSAGGFGLVRYWNNLGLRYKLAAIMGLGVALPVIAVTQTLVTLSSNALQNELEARVKTSSQILSDEVQSLELEVFGQAADLSQAVQSDNLNPNNLSQVQARQQFLNGLLSAPFGNEAGVSFQVVVDAEGRTVAQNIQQLASLTSPLPKGNTVQPATYQLVKRPLGISLGNLPIIRSAISGDRPLKGVELLPGETLQRLGIAEQANIGLKTQNTDGLPDARKPFPVGTFDVDQGKAGLVVMGVHPIKINGKVAGAAIVGTMLNRNSILVDSVRLKAGLDVATLFARDWRITTNVPTANGQGRAVGTRLARSVANVVLNQGKPFVGPTEILGKSYITTYLPIYDYQQELKSARVKPVGIAFTGVERSKLYAVVQQETWLGYGVGGAVLLLAIALLLPISGSFVKPLLQLSNFARKVGQGDVSSRLETTDRRDEIGVLTQEMNQMVANLEQGIAEQDKLTQEQLAVQAAFVEQQTQNARQELAAKELLQNRALELLMEVGPLRNGDLTIRANVTEDEIGTIADSYNATIQSLRKLVTQVQQAAGEVSQTADSNEVSVQALATDALQQSEAMQGALKRIAEMTTSIQTVSASAQSAQQAVQLANQTVNQGDAAMNRTVAGILTIRETVTDTAKKVQQLGESSQKISKVVKLIGNFAAQTNLLALKASIEAARAGDEGRGFVVLADEVRSLAQQSAKATEEIEQLVTSIQIETNQVAAAMAAGTEQVATGTQLVEETRLSLNQIAQASDQIAALVQAIAQAAIAQAQASTEVSATITDAATISDTTSGRANQVLDSFQDLLKVAQELQTTVSQFKLS